MSTHNDIATNPADKPPTPKLRRNKWMLALALLAVGLGVGYGAYWYGIAQYHVETDNAYVQGNVVQVTPQITGTVLAVSVQDTDYVEAGQVLIKLDPADVQVALDQARAELAQTQREVRTTYANNSTLQANIAVRQAQVVNAQTEVTRAQEDVVRRRPLVDTGAIGVEEMRHADTNLANTKAAYNAALAALKAAREQLATNQALTENATVETHPNVMRSQAKVREAELALKRSAIIAPVSGYIAQRSVQLGQHIQAGTPLMAIIPLEQVWVDANFKESQLRDMRIGQPVHLNADMYGKKIEYTGTLEGLSAGTGAAFSLLPAQNATGNWIKVVQRVPVRIALDARQLTQNPLRIGLSMQVTVDTHDRSGKVLAGGPRASVAENKTRSPKTASSI